MLSITDISVRIAGRLLIDNSSVQIVPGSRVGFVGRNGVGKSTLFHAIRGELPTETGSISIPPRWRIGSLAQEAPDGPESLIDGRAEGRPGARRAAGRSRDRARSVPHRRNPDPARRHRRAFGAGPRRRDPERPRIFHRRSGAILFGIFRRLAHARRAGGDAVFGARSAAAGRADQLPRSRRHAVARGSSGELSAHRDRHQP